MVSPLLHTQLHSLPEITADYCRSNQCDPPPFLSSREAQHPSSNGATLYHRPNTNATPREQLLKHISQLTFLPPDFLNLTPDSSSPATTLTSGSDPTTALLSSKTVSDLPYASGKTGCCHPSLPHQQSTNNCPELVKGGATSKRMEAHALRRAMPIATLNRCVLGLTPTTLRKHVPLPYNTAS